MGLEGKFPSAKGALKPAALTQALRSVHLKPESRACAALWLHVPTYISWWSRSFSSQASSVKFKRSGVNET